MKRFYKILLTFSLFAFSFSMLYAQQQNIDSLYKALKTEQEDTNKVKTLNYLANREYKRSNYHAADSLAQYALKLSEMKDYPVGAGNAYMNIGVCYLELSNYSGALNSYRLAMKKYEEAGYEQGKGNAYGGIGSFYMYQGNYPQALKYMLQALKIAEQQKSLYSMGVQYGNIGLVYGYLGDYANAMKYYQLALEPKEKSGNRRGLGNTYGNIANVYEAQGKYDSAMKNYQRAINISTEAGNKSGLGTELSDLGNLYYRQGNYAEATKYQQQSLGIEREIGSQDDICIAYNRLGNINVKEKNASKAKLYFDSAFAVASNIGSKSGKRDAYLGRYAMDSLTGNSAAAIIDYRSYIAWRDSLKNEQTSRAMLSEQMTYEFDKKQAEEKAQEEKKESVAAAERNKQVAIRNFFIVGFSLMIVLAFFIFRGYRQKQKDNAVITRQKEEMERLSIVARETDNLVLIMAADGTVEWANESFARINGITLDEVKKLRGNTIYEISNNPNIRSIIDTAVRERRSVVYESLNDKKEGERQWESSTLTPIFDTDGKLHKLIIVDADITLRKVAEETIRQKNKDIVDSITYAKRLQEAMLPPLNKVEKLLPDSFIFYKPKDIVAGDFYWMETVPITNNRGEIILIAACDCTGHGVPGAMVSVVCANALHRALNEYFIRDVGKLLDKTRELVLDTFSQGVITREDGSEDVNDGMDGSFCALNLKDMKLEWAGANNPLWYVRDGKLVEILPDKQPIGKYDAMKPFTTYHADLRKGDIIYLFTDGYADQFGGPKDKKFKQQQLKDMLSDISSQPMKEQKRLLEKSLEEWKGNLEQVDDILVIGIRV